MKLIQLWRTVDAFVTPKAQAVLLLFVRLYVAQVFFASGLTKLRDWSTTVFLFTEEYHVPVLPPAVAAVAGTTGEVLLPVLLVLGVFTRFGAAGLFILNGVAVISYPGLAEAALAQHFLWGVMLATLMCFGAGPIAGDALWHRLTGRAPGHSMRANCASAMPTSNARPSGSTRNSP